jgi:hypothetical protein
VHGGSLWENNDLPVFCGDGHQSRAMITPCILKYFSKELKDFIEFITVNELIRGLPVSSQ